MPNKCCAISCKSGYATNNNNNISLHKFPSDPDLRQQWMNCLHRENFIPSKNAHLCSKHFRPSDFVNDRTDSNHYRNRGQLIRKRLKLTAVPSVFLELPLHLQPQQTVQRSTAAISTTRWENTLEEHDNVNNNFLNADTVSNVGDTYKESS